VTLLGQNVNSYHDKDDNTPAEHLNSAGFSEMYKIRGGEGARFADLVAMVSEAAPEIRFRFTSPHPKDFPDQLLDVIASRANVCK
jgi:tRNA A37 methylthiotransferase MiaB